MLPPEIHVEGVPGQFRYDLPTRRLGRLRWIGLIPVVFSLVFIAAPVGGLGRILHKAASRPEGVFQWMFVVFLSAFVVAGCIPMGIGLFILAGRCRIECRDGELSAVELAGPFRRKRRLGKRPIARFDVKASAAKVNGKPVTSGPLADVSALVVEFADGETRFLAIGYPQDWLVALAQDLSARMGVTTSTGQAIPVQVTDDEAEREEDKVISQPLGSRVRRETRPDGLTLVVPAAGLWRGSKGMILMGVFWCGFMALSSAAVLSQAKHGPWFLYVFLTLLWAIGISFLLASINMGRRHARLTVDAGVFQIAQTNLFGAKQWRWQRGEIAAIRADSSGMIMNDVPVNEFQVYPASGKRIGFFAGRDDEELRWMASELRRVLRVPARAEAEPESAPPIKPRS